MKSSDESLTFKQQQELAEEFTICLSVFTNLTLKPKERYDNYRRMTEITEQVGKSGMTLKIHAAISPPSSLKFLYT